MLDLSTLKQEHTRWVGVAAFPDVRLMVRHVGPEAMEKFRQKLVRAGIVKKDEGLQWNDGRFADWCAAVATECMVDWEGVKLNPEDSGAYTPDGGKELLLRVHGAGRAVMEALTDEAGFFSENGSGSHV